MKCNSCGLEFNEADLSQVFAHEHDNQFIMGKQNIGKKVIKNARDIYPYCGGEFAAGVHTYLNGNPCPQRPCSDIYIQGWLCAERDLKNDYILEF